MKFADVVLLCSFLDVRINAMDDLMRFVRPMGSNVVLPGFKPMNLESIQWSFLNYKTRKTIIQYSHFKLTINPFYRHRAEFNVTSGVLLLRDLQLKDSGIYEVVLNPKVNKTLMKGDEISSIHLDVQGNLFIHEDALVGSVIVLVSTVTSFTASAFIVYALEKDQVKIYWLHVTSAILVFHGMSLFCQLIAFVIFNINTGFSILYRAGSGIGCILCLATVTYVMVLFLHHHSQDSLSFLSNYWKRNIFLGSEIIAMLIACLPLIKSKQNLKKCRLTYHALSVKIILMVMLYVCGLGLFSLFHAKFSFKLRRNYVKLKEVKQYKAEMKNLRSQL